VLGPAVGIAASAQAAEAIKILVGSLAAVRRTLLSFDLWENTRSAIRIDRPRADCPCCGLGRFEFLEGRAGGTASVLCGQDAVQVWPADDAVIDLTALAVRLCRLGQFSQNGTLLSGRVTGATTAASNPIEITVFGDGRAIVRGTRDPAEARSIYARYIGV
jgi:molybdopterin-synthase adenylyltransferase